MKRLVTRGTAALAVAAAMAVLFVVARVQHPDQRVPQPRAGTAATATVTQRALRETVIVRGTIAAPHTVSTEPSAASDQGSDPLITATPVAVGQSVNEGQVVLEVAGRPIFLLQGALPSYRDLRAGQSGPDVVQVQAALARLGHPVSDPSGTYGLSTAEAVAAMYRSAGYEPPEPADGAADQLTSLESSLADAQQALTQAQAQNSGATRLQLQVAVSAAKRALASAQAAASDTAATDAARVAAAQAAVTAGETDASVGLIDAQAQQRTNKRTSDEAVASALEQVAIANAALSDATTGAGQQTVAAAQSNVDRLATQLDTARQAAATPLPRAEVMFVPVAPAVATSVGVVVGDRFTSGSSGVSVSTGDLAVQVSVSEGVAAAIPSGAKADVTLLDGSVVTGTAQRTASGSSATATASGTSDSNVSLEVTPDQPLDRSLIGADVKVVISVSGSDDQVLAVPLRSVHVRSDGSAWLDRIDASRRTRVDVTVGAVVDGWVGVEPKSGSLKAGDRIVLGRT